MRQPTLFDAERDDAPDAIAAPPDQAARDFATDPANHVVLEASAGTGKTRVLVDRYVRLVEAGVDPRHILAITFTRKAAAEMRGRVLAELRRRADLGAIARDRWQRLLERVSDIEISTIDAFCFSLLREFPLEANVDPGFEIADETEMARFVDEALDLTFQAAAGLMTDEAVRLLFARVKPPVLRSAMASLIDRRHVALPAVARFLARGPVLTAAELAAACAGRLRETLASAAYRPALFDDGPRAMPEFERMAADLAALDDPRVQDPARVRQLRRRLERYFLTTAGAPRKKLLKEAADALPSRVVKERHQNAVAAFAPVVAEELKRLDAGIDRLLARGLQRLLAIAVGHYERLLDDRALLDFAGMLDRAVALVERQEEFARSRLKLQARYHHVLVDEVQDTSRKQWRLISLLVEAWGEGEGASDAPTSIFVVGDRKQSIYRFRHAEVTLLDELADRIGALRPGGRVRQAITTSFRAVPELLAFVNALSAAIQSVDATLPERFTYGDTDRFPVASVAPGARRDGTPVIGLVAQPSMREAAEAVADEIARLLETTLVRDRDGAARPARPDDIAILFRARAGHQYYEKALDARGIPTYVYKGLGFFDAPEVQDLQALLRYLARPDSDLRAAELLRSRLVRLSDDGLARLAASGFARALASPAFDVASVGLGDLDARLLRRARAGAAVWRRDADRVRPSELVDAILRDTAYAFELGGRRRAQARENVKKVRALVRRVENRGYATLDRLAAYFDTLRAGDEANAVVEAAGAVNLMTMHAAKGLEFPIVFLVNLHAAGRGRTGGVSVIEHGVGGEPDVAFRSTDSTALEDRREAEELRRLFYVAATRARDRLYLSAEIDEKGAMRRGARSLAALLPREFGALFAKAATAAHGGEVEWTVASDTFACRVCHPVGAHAQAEAHASSDAAAESPRRVDVDVPRSAPAATVMADAPAAPVVPAPLHAIGRRIVAATTDAAGSVAPSADAPALAASPSPRIRRTGLASAAADAARPRGDQLTGIAVHALFQCAAPLDWTDDELAEVARRAIRREAADDEDLAAIGLAAASLYRRFRARPDVAALLAAGACYFEVPFSFVPPDRPDEQIRGVIDCVVIKPDGSAAVLELKTGAERPEHAAQAALYAQAMRAALGRDDVAVHILYS